MPRKYTYVLENGTGSVKVGTVTEAAQIMGVTKQVITSKYRRGKETVTRNGWTLTRKPGALEIPPQDEYRELARKYDDNKELARIVGLNIANIGRWIDGKFTMNPDAFNIIKSLLENWQESK